MCVYTALSSVAGIRGSELCTCSHLNWGNLIGLSAGWNCWSFIWSQWGCARPCQLGTWPSFLLNLIFIPHYALKFLSWSQLLQYLQGRIFGSIQPWPSSAPSAVRIFVVWQSQMGWIQSDLAVALSIKPFAELHRFQSMKQGELGCFTAAWGSGLVSACCANKRKLGNDGKSHHLHRKSAFPPLAGSSRLQLGTSRGGFQEAARLQRNAAMPAVCTAGCLGSVCTAAVGAFAQ